MSDLFATALRHQQDGQLPQAEALYRRILEHEPRHAGALHLLGVLTYQRGDCARAIELIRRAIAIDPAGPTYHNNLGVALKADGRLEEAVASYKEALRLAPDYADAHCNLGTALHLNGQLDLARTSFATALGLDPDHAGALCNLGSLLHYQGDSERAISHYRQALQIAPGRPEVWNNLGNALLVCERAEEAIAAYRRALEIDTGRIDARLNLATALALQDRHEDASRVLSEAAQLRPEWASWPILVAAQCPAVFPSRESLGEFRNSLEAALDAHPNGVLDWDGDDQAAAECIPSFNLAHHGHDDRDLRAKFAALFRDDAPRRRPRPDPGPPRIGFVVTHGHESVFLRCNAGLINHMTPGRFRLLLFSPARGLEMLRRAIRHPDATFLDLPQRFRPAAERIGAADCDLLYHWEVGTDPLNYFLPFDRLAPVQCTSWGVQVTTGVPAVDYYLSSALVEAPGADAHYTETLVRLASLLSYQARRPAPNPPAPPREFGLPPTAHLYLCPQRPLKVHPDLDALLAAILRRDPLGFVILLRGRSGIAADQLAARFRTTLPDVADRVVWLPWQEEAAYHRLLTLADVVLDPLHYGAGSSCYDIFSHDLPLVTLPGPYNASRYAQACYRKMGLPDLVASSPAHYVDLAIRLGTDPDYRRDVTARIAAASPVLFEDMDVVREHEWFFERAVKQAGP